MTKRFPSTAAALLLAGSLTAAPAGATVIVDCVNSTITADGLTVPCTPAPTQHTCTNGGITAADDGETIQIVGNCITSAFTTITKPVHLTGTCGSGIERLFNPAGGTALRISDGGTGTIIENLRIQGNTNAISNSILLPQNANPDFVVIRNNELIALSLPTGGRCIQQFTGNGCGGPNCNRNDVNPCDGVTLETVSNGWVIERNRCTSDEVGLLLSGNGFLVRKNYIDAGDRGIAVQNNHLSPVSVGVGGSAAGAQNNVFAHNVVTTLRPSQLFGPATGNTALPLIEFGLDIFGGLIGVPACPAVFGGNNQWDHNCARGLDDGAAGGALGFTSISTIGSTAHHNNINLDEPAAGGLAGGNGGVANFGSDFLTIEHNKIDGGDIAIQGAAIGAEIGVVANHNHIGHGTAAFPGPIAILDGSPTPNTYCGNLYCDTMVVVVGPEDDVCAAAGPGNQAKTAFCRGVSKPCKDNGGTGPHGCGISQLTGSAPAASDLGAPRVTAATDPMGLRGVTEVEVDDDVLQSASELSEQLSSGARRR